MKQIPIFEYYDETQDKENTPLIEQAKMAKKIYNFCIKNKTNIIIVKNNFNNYNAKMRINLKGMMEYLKYFEI